MFALLIKLLMVLLVGAMLLLPVSHARQPAPSLLLLVSDSHDEYDTAATTALTLLAGRSGWKDRYDRMPLPQWQQGQPVVPELLVTVGLPATRAVLQQRLKQPVLAVMVPSESFAVLQRQYSEQFGAPAAGMLSAIFMDQPLQRLQSLAELLGDGRWKTGVLLSDQSIVLQQQVEQLRQKQVPLSLATVASKRDIVSAFRRDLPQIDAALIAYDPALIDVTTTKQLLYLSYRRRLPVIAYSQSMLRAGAVAGIYSQGTAIGRQLGEWLQQLSPGGAVRLPEPGYARYFQVDCNETVARYLDLVAACGSNLQGRMEALER